jgi:hypothetical protein
VVASGLTSPGNGDPADVATSNEERHDELRRIWARLDHLVVGCSVAPMLPEARAEYEALVDREYSLLAIVRAGARG